MNSSVKNSDIAVRQNSADMLRLLKARQYRWAIAVRWQKAQIAVVLLAPILAVTLGQYSASSKTWIAAVAVLMTVVDVTVTDRAYKTALKMAARASELFDTSLLRMEWNSVIAGPKPTPEQTDRWVRGWEGIKSKNVIENWYDESVGQAPISIARPICQRTNLTYDSDLRGVYITWLIIATVTVVAFVNLLGLFSSAAYSDVVLNGFVPSGPFLIWALREIFRQSDAVKANTPIITEAETLIEAAINGTRGDHDCEMKSRLLQDAIFVRRANTVLLFPGIYRLHRPNAELDMRAGAEFWVNKARKAK